MNETFTKAKTLRFLRRFLNLAFWVGLAACIIILIAQLVMPSFITESGLVFNGFVLSTSSSSASWIHYLILVAAMGCGLFCLWLLRGIAYSITEETPFVPKNASRIRLIGIVLLIQTYLSQLLNYLYVREINTVAAISASIIKPQLNLLPDGALVGLCIVFLAEIYRYGCTLQHEHDMTV